MTNPIDFASLLCSRLCHDLLSPVGALNNGLELLADETDPAMRERCMELLAESARASAGKLKFFRLAFGAGGGLGENIDTREAQAALTGLIDSRRVELAWLVNEPALPKGAVKVLLNLAMLASDALVRGGRLDVGAELADDSVEIVLRAEGLRIVLDEELRRVLVSGQPDGLVSPRAAPAFLAHSLVTAGRGTIQLGDVDGEQPGLLIGATMRAR
jgi:histidine phosphotransferase ChpT